MVTETGERNEGRVEGENDLDVGQAGLESASCFVEDSDRFLHNLPVFLAPCQPFFPGWGVHLLEKLISSEAFRSTHKVALPL